MRALALLAVAGLRCAGPVPAAVADATSRGPDQAETVSQAQPDATIDAVTVPDAALAPALSDAAAAMALADWRVRLPDSGLWAEKHLMLRTFIANKVAPSAGGG